MGWGTDLGAQIRLTAMLIQPAPPAGTRMVGLEKDQAAKRSWMAGRTNPQNLQRRTPDYPAAR